MLGYKANVKKADFKISEEVDSAEWVKFEDALSLLREGSIGWQLVKKIIESHDDKQSETTIIKKNTVGLR